MIKSRPGRYIICKWLHMRHERGKTTFLFLPRSHFKFNFRYLYSVDCKHWWLPIRCLPNSFSIVCTVWLVAVVKFHSHSTFSRCDGESCNNPKPPCPSDCSLQVVISHLGLSLSLSLFYFPPLLHLVLIYRVTFRSGKVSENDASSSDSSIDGNKWWETHNECTSILLRNQSCTLLRFPDWE